VPVSALAAIILAGGRSQRMGQDKAALVWDGQAAVHRIADLARQAGAQSVTVSGGDYGLPFVPDLVAHGGPVSGLLTAAQSLPDSERLLVLAVDTPTLAVEDLRPLLAAPSPGASYVGHPLPMVIARSAIPWNMPADSPLRRLVEQAGLSQHPPPPAAVCRLRGANTPEEFEDLRRSDRPLQVIP
jgi:molybdopterin-guanine dinucleotide biosynthesis protein A